MSGVGGPRPDRRNSRRATTLPDPAGQYNRAVPDADPSRRSGADVCPGALHTYPAADGALARVRVPGGALTGRQLRTLATAAVELGDGGLELTSRANVQLRALAEGAPAVLAGLLREAGLLPSASHERVRNIIASPLAGRRGGGPDLQPLVGALDRALCGCPELAELPGRFLFAVDDSTGDVAGLGADVAVLATPEPDGTGPDGTDGTLALLLAGTDSGLRLAPGDAVTGMVAAAAAFLAERARQGGTAWRLAELSGGPRRVADRVRAALGPAARPADVPVHPPDTVRRGSVGLVEQSDGRFALAVVVPLNRLSAGQAEVLADAADAAAADRPVLRLTPWRSVLVLDLPMGEAVRWSGVARAAGLVLDAGSPWVGVTACAGRPGCAHALADVRADAARVAARLTGGGAPVHWAGCGRHCGKPPGEVVEVLATGAGYRVSAGGDVSADTATLDQTAAAVAAARAAAPAAARRGT
jgi:precorrin-3B synthase